MKEKKLSEKDIDTLEKELANDIKKLKPKPPPKPTIKRTETMAKKSLDTGLEEVKAHLKDQYIIKTYEKALDPKQQTATQQPASNVNAGQQTNVKPQPQEDAMFKGVRPKDLKGVDSDILEKFVELKMIDKNPDLYKLLRNKSSGNDFKDKLFEKLIDKVLFTPSNNEPKEPKEPKEDVKDILLSKLIDKVFTPQPQDNSQYAMMKEMHEREITMLEKLNQEKTDRLLDQMREIQQSIPPSPFEWLQNQKDQQEAVRNLFSNPQPQDYKGQLSLKQQDHVHELELKKINREMEKDKLEQSKSMEMTSLIKEGIKTFTDKISESVGGAIGQIGKDQLGQLDMPATIPLESVEQDVFQNTSPNNMFNPNNPDNILQPQYPQPQYPQPQPTIDKDKKKVKKYPGGFTTYGT